MNRLELPQTRPIDLNTLTHEEAAQGLDVWTIVFLDGPFARGAREHRTMESTKFERWLPMVWPPANALVDMEVIDVPQRERKKYIYEMVDYDACRHLIRMKLASPLRAQKLERGLAQPGK